MLFSYIFDWYWDVDPLCIACGYTLYSYMTWICSVFDWKPWFNSSQAWLCLPQRDNYYFADGTSRAHSILYIGEDVVMCFSHQLLLWPHTLGGIFYSPKIPYSCIHGIGPLTCIIFQIIVEKIYLKNHFWEHVHTLHHYILHTYACCTLDNLRTYTCCTLNNPRVPLKVAKIKNL
jgi:hypothetical protein